MKVAFALLAIALTAGCSTTGSKKPEPDAAQIPKNPDAGPELVGRIASVPTGKSFVLIQRYGKWEATSGQILTTRGAEDRAANLRITGETLGEFTAADVQSGTLEIGDGVYAREQPAPAPASPLSEEAANATFEKVQKNN